jgi:hypothetical protein
MKLLIVNCAWLFSRRRQIGKVVLFHPPLAADNFEIPLGGVSFVSGLIDWMLMT